ncbi:MAG: adenylate/guanylate cyclase domain-containing protein [Actinobacteria bacterium]|nr:adenylate/guanylate cyclase domain-containing protein [Actinomycetota bacterium]
MEIPEVQYARNGDVALAYQVLGEGPIDLVFLPAFINNVEIVWESPQYSRFLRRLASFSRLIFMDRRGTGLSDRFSPADLPPLEVLMDDLAVVLDAAGSEHTALFGYSDSGCLCAMFAATHPDRVSALVLYAVAAAGVATEDFPWQWSPDEWDDYFRDLASGWGTRAYADKVVPWFQPSLADDERHKAWWARFMRQAASPNSVEAIERIWHLIDIRPILPTIQVPTLVLHRTDDQVEYVQAGRDVAERIPGARFIELAGGDDAPWAGDQETVLDEVEQFLTGKRHMPEIDRVLATVLFTDIVGSTKKAAALGDGRWGELLTLHHERVRAELERFRGREIATAGDGFLATFDGPARAVLCGQAIAEAVHDLGIEVRAGAHTGEIELDGDDVRGIAVHIGARVGALAEPSEVLVSSTVKDLVAGSGLSFEDAGEHELKGVPDRWHLYRVVSEQS